MGGLLCYTFLEVTEVSLVHGSPSTTLAHHHSHSIHGLFLPSSSRFARSSASIRVHIPTPGSTAIPIPSTFDFNHPNRIDRIGLLQRISDFPLAYWTSSIAIFTTRTSHIVFKFYPFRIRTAFVLFFHDSFMTLTYLSAHGQLFLTPYSLFFASCCLSCLSFTYTYLFQRPHDSHDDRRLHDLARLLCSYPLPILRSP